ncbi:hypothetical protein ABZ901_16100 [Actinacidiphila alni]|uniref:Uncharacterized protein n=1 Tax=Actinacidiphila alni TaxID=380248 RepID=A0A1I2DJX6_9ACTN|nr:hypothetical protein [Actinacidiphila alni]SFE80767.1 hypothetical protein SAMN05216251_105268 [Actinacidiphila alni]
MRKHRFEPAVLVMGLVLLTLMVCFILDVCRVWDLRPGRSVPLVVGGLLVAVATAILTQVVRAVRGRRTRPRT